MPPKQQPTLPAEKTEQPSYGNDGATAIIDDGGRGRRGWSKVLCCVEEELMPIYDTDIEDVIEEEEGFVRKGGFYRKDDNVKCVVVVANDLCFSMIQTTLSVDFEKDINTKSHELMWFGKSIIIKFQGSSMAEIRNSLQSLYLDGDWGCSMGHMNVNDVILEERNGRKGGNNYENEGNKMVTNREKHVVLQGIRKKQDCNSEISVVNKAGKREQMREIRNRVIDISISLMGIRVMDCDDKDVGYGIKNICDENVEDADMELDNNNCLGVIDKVCNKARKDENGKGFELLENRSLEFAELAEVDCDTIKTFNFDLEGKFSLETGNRSGSTYLVANTIMSEDDTLKIQEKNKDNEDKQKRDKTCPWWLDKHIRCDMEGDEVNNFDVSIVTNVDIRKQNKDFRKEIRDDQVVESNDLGEVNDNKRVVIMDEAKHLVRGGFEIQMEIVGGMESSTNRITRNHMVTGKPLFGKFVKNSVVKNGNEVLDDVCDIKRERGVKDDRKNKWVDWKELVFKAVGMQMAINLQLNL
nr:hypothetical protein [Tanacetum cinerariifolium]